MPNYPTLRRLDPLLATPEIDPFQLMRSSLRRIQDLVGYDPLADVLDPGPVAEVATRTRFAPEFDLCECEGELLLTADLPGVRTEDVDIQVSGRQLRIRGKREIERKAEGAHWYAAERAWGSFARTFTLPEGVDADTVRADLTNGVLTVRLPRPAVPAAKRIAVGGEAKAPPKAAAAPQGKKNAAKEREKAKV